MMRGLKLSLRALLALVMAGLGCVLCRPGSLYEYFSLPSHGDIEKYRELRDIRTALSKIESAASIKPSAQSILGHIIKLKSKSRDPFETDVYEELISLTDGTNTCTGSFIKYIIDILGIIEDRKERWFGAVGAYLNHFGRKKFRLCAEEFERQFVLSRWASDEEVLLDKFFMLALGLDRRMDDVQYYQHLVKFDLARDNINIAAVEHFLIETSPLEKQFIAIKTREHPLSFLPDTCPRVLKSIEKGLNILNLARHFSNYRIDHIKLRKLNEYNRVCLSMTKVERRPVTEANIKRQLGYRYSR